MQRADKVPLYVCTGGLLAQGIYLERRLLGIGLAKAPLSGGIGGLDVHQRLGLADRKQLDVIGATADAPGGLYNTFLYLKQVLGNLAHISFVIL